MERTYINDIKPSLDGKKVKVCGWIHEIRDQSKIKFILLRDITGIIQMVSFIEDKKIFEEITKIPRESVIEAIGKVKKSKQAPNGIEICIEEYKILNKSEVKLPIPVVEKGNIKTALYKRLDYRSIDLRKPKNLAIFKIQSALIEGMQDYLNKERFLQVFTPCIMGVASESGSEVFKIDYFKKNAFLRQDPQLHRQLTILGGIEKLYDIGPSWRAEKSHTVKHICEHRTCAVELAFINDEADTMRVEEQLVVSGIKNVINKCKNELDLLGVKLKVPKTPFPELRFPKIYDILNKNGKDIYGEDLDSEAEKILWDYMKKKYKSEFYFFNRFPHEIKPFYVMGVDEDPKWARSVDLNFKGLELSSGGQREHRYEQLIKNVKERKMPLNSVEWFTKFFKYGAPPHGGFAIGIERITQMLLGLPNIREATLFPRDPERTTP
jgi:aspartyl-tRNA synthetase